MAVAVDRVMEAIGEHLLDMLECPPVVWPNQKPIEGLASPYIAVQMAYRRYRDPSLSGDMEHATGAVLVSVVTETNTSYVAAERIAEVIRCHFRNNMVLPVGDDGEVRITSPANVMAGYTDQVNFRIPVLIEWMAK